MTARAALLARIAAALVVVALLVWTLQGLEQPRGPRAVFTDEPALPRYSVSGAEWTRHGDDGRVEIRIQAQRIDWYDDRSARLQQLAVQAPPDREPRWLASAPSGSVAAGSTVLSLDGPVSGDGWWPDGRPAHFDTPRLDLDWSSQQLFTDQGVQLSGSGRQGSANQLAANWNQHSAQLKGQVRIRYVAR